MRRREFITLSAVMAAASRTFGLLHANGQPSPGPPLGGMLSPQTPSTAGPQAQGLSHRLARTWLCRGPDIELDIRFSEGISARLPRLAAELVARKPTVLLAFSTAAVGTASNATQTIPLVIATLEDPVARGLVKSIARPGTNAPERGWLVTRAWWASGLRCSRTWCRACRASALSSIRTIRRTSIFYKGLPGAARALRLELRLFEVRAASQFDAAFSKAARDSMQALFIGQSPLFNTNRTMVVGLAAGLRLPAIYGFREFADAGGLMSYGPSLPDMYGRTAILVDRILKGANPADLPVEIPIGSSWSSISKLPRRWGLRSPTRSCRAPTR